VTEHYTTNTESVTRFCNRCGRPTQHRVSGGRVGRCMEHESPHESKRQVKARKSREEAEKNPPLFE
jgi:hypothetical protein